MPASGHDLAARVAKLEDSVKLAFPANDLGQPDFDGHRRDHAHRIAQAQKLREYQTDVTKRVLGIGVTALLAMLVSGFLEYLKAALK